MEYPAKNEEVIESCSMERSSGLHHFGATTQDLASWVVIGIRRHFKLIYSMFDGTFFCFNSLSHKVLPNNPSPLGSRVSHKTERGARGYTNSNRFHVEEYVS